MTATADKRQAFDYRHIVCIVITLCFAFCGVLWFSASLGRIIESLRDLCVSIGFFFCELFGISHDITPTVNDLPQDFGFWRSSSPSTFLPTAWTGFVSGFYAYWRLWTSAGNFTAYMVFIGEIVYTVLLWTLALIPLVLTLRFLLKHYLKTTNNDYNADSRALTVFKHISMHTYMPIKLWLINYVAFVRAHKPYYVVWLCMWLFYFNAFAIILEFIAFYFYFAVSFDVFNIYTQVYKLFMDLSVPITAIPLWAWIIIGLVLGDRFRKSIAYAKLNHFEMRNRGFINARPIVYMVCGTMGKKKTTAITDMALSQEVMFRDKAFEKILETDLKFPFFPYCNLENAIKCEMDTHRVYNLATMRLYIDCMRQRFETEQSRNNIYDYDYERYGLIYDDKLRVWDIWDVLQVYAQLYFVYIIQSSLLISNYSIRVDNVLSDLGNFPLWNAEFFKQDSRLLDSYSRHAHILDFDSLRLGQKVIENNRNANCFEFGVVVITEVGKERGNAIELSEKKKKDDTANQKNDNFNGWLKMVRHSATVDNFPFVRVITDEQRPESWGKDARDLCEIVHIRESGETRLAMPFFSLAELLYSLLFGKFASLYYEYRFVRADNTLPMYLLKSVTARIHHYYTRIYNRFGYCILRVQIESGTQDGQLDENKYYIMHKKIYSKRFSTDCFSDFFAVKACTSTIGINDLCEYETEKATFAELSAQNSYFINDLLGGLDNIQER